MPLGLEDRRLADPTMTSSTYYNYYLAPWNGRLHSRRQGRRGPSWSAKGRDRQPWLQVDFGALTKVTRVATQGRENSNQWVKKYWVSYSMDGSTFHIYKENGRIKVIYIFIASYLLPVFILRKNMKNSCHNIEY